MRKYEKPGFQTSTNILLSPNENGITVHLYLLSEIWNNCQVHKRIVIAKTLQYIKQLILS
jgi:hypothetical protein